MTDDLVKIIRWYTAHNERIMPQHAKAAADRIEKLEAALRCIEDEDNYGSDGCWVADSYPDEIARKALDAE
jgi:hypothetical protein